VCPCNWSHGGHPGSTCDAASLHSTDTVNTPLKTLTTLVRPPGGRPKRGNSNVTPLNNLTLTTSPPQRNPYRCPTGIRHRGAPTGCNLHASAVGLGFRESAAARFRAQTNK
jgi:hypothetical protein